MREREGRKPKLKLAKNFESNSQRDSRGWRYIRRRKPKLKLAKNFESNSQLTPVKKSCA